MSKKLWDWFYFKPVDHIDILRSESIDKGREMHEAISKRMKELIDSGSPLKFIGPISPICFEHFVDDTKKVECDYEVKILKNRNSTKPIVQWFVDSEAEFDKKMIKNLHVVCSGPTTSEKIQTNGRQLKAEKLPVNDKYDNIPNMNNDVYLNKHQKEIDFAEEQIKKIKLNQNNDHYCFEVDRGSVDNSKEKNKKLGISICSSCNYHNEYIDFDPNYKCLKCKNGW